MGSREFRVILRTKTFEDYETTVAFYRDGLELPVIASWDRNRDRVRRCCVRLLRILRGMNFQE